MKKLSSSFFTIFLLYLLTACTSNASTQESLSNDDKVATIVAGTLSAIPTFTDISIIEFMPTAESTEEIVTFPTNTPIPILAPLYWELTWENLGRSEQEISLNWQTGERVTLAGYTYQAPFPMNNDTKANNVFTYYSNENMANMGWKFIGGGGNAAGILTEFYNESGYFLTIRHTSGQSQLMIVWISDETIVVPVVPTAQN